MVKLYPSWDEINTMVPAPEPGERQVLQFLEQVFQDDDDLYEIYFQPNFSGICPDIAVLSQHHGVLVIEVKDWHLNAYTPRDDESWGVINAKAGTYIRSPFAQADSYKKNLYRYPLRLLTFHTVLNKNVYSVMQVGVFFTNASRSEIKPFLPKKKDYTYCKCWGKEDFSDIDSFRNSLGTYFIQNKSIYFTDDVYKEIQMILGHSEDMKLNQQRVILNAKQKALLKRNTSFKVKGAAGSGKTELLAQKAVQRYEETGFPVLILTFNITLRGYIEDRIKRILRTTTNTRFSAKNFIILHYHAYLNIYADKEGKTGKDEKYHTILVDEAQDFQETWVQNILDWLTRDGRIYFFGDERQNIYKNKMQEDHTPYTGIKGSWNILPATSYRTKNRRLTDFCSAFQKQFLAEYYGYEPLLYQGSLFDVDTMITYTQFQEFAPEQVYNLFQEYRTDQGIHNCDICFLSSEIFSLREIRDILEKNNFSVECTFETTQEYKDIMKRFGEYPDELEKTLKEIRRPYKFRFRAGSGMTKMATIQSFKGWQIPTVFLIINNTSLIADEDKDKEQNNTSPDDRDALLYTAITRAETNLYIMEFGTSQYTEFFKQSPDVSIFNSEE